MGLFGKYGTGMRCAYICSEGKEEIGELDE